MRAIAVVLLNWNGVELLKKFLPILVKYSTQAAIYVVDNASIDDSVAYVTMYFPEVKIINNTKNLGYAQGYNQALQQIQEPYWALVNSDVQVTSEWLYPILSIFENQPKTAIIQPKIRDYNNPDYFEYAGAAGGFIDKFGFPYCRGRIFETLEKDMGQYDNECDIFWASGACFFVRKNVFKELNGFDADFFAHQEEIDLCWRAINQGYHIKYTPNSIVYHIGATTLHKSNPKKTFLNFRNSLWMLLKNLPKTQLVSILFIRLSLDGIAAYYFLSQGKTRHSLAVLQSHIAFYYYLYKTIKKRKPIVKTSYYTTRSIIYEYFIKRKKYFMK